VVYKETLEDLDVILSTLSVK